MGSEQQNKNAILSQIVYDLSVKSASGEELSSKVRRLREEIKKVAENENTVFGKFRTLVESFREILPEEKQRYHAAIKALSATSKLSPQEIIAGVSNQLEELKILEKGLIAAIPGWRDELRAMESKARELKDDIARLRETIGRLENEEKGILVSMAARQKDMELVEKSVGEVFTDVGAVITSVKKKIEEYSVEGAAAPQPIPPRTSAAVEIPVVKKAVEEKKEEISVPSAPQQDTEWQKKCPMCGGRMDFHMKENKWMCYTCAYEEASTNGVPVAGEEKSAGIESPAPQQSTAWQKKCPMCGGMLNYHGNEKMWLCYTCAHEEPATEDIPGTTGGYGATAPDFAPASASAIEFEEPRKTPQSKPHPTKKKTCPACRKKMNWYEEDKAWRCPFCEYERKI